MNIQYAPFYGMLVGCVIFCSAGLVDGEVLAEPDTGVEGNAVPIGHVVRHVSP